MVDPTYPGVARRRQIAGVLSPNREGCAELPGFPGLGRPWPRVETDPYEDGLPKKRHDPCRQTRPPAGHGGPVWSPDTALMDTVARLQLDMEELRAGSRSRRTPPPDIWTSQGPPRQVAFTSTNVPRFAGVTRWEQYKQVFDAIV